MDAGDADLELEYTRLFETIQNIVEMDPEQVPELFVVLLAGAAFRPFLDQPELMNRAVVEAKKLAAEGDAALDPDARANVATQTKTTTSVNRIAPKTGPSKA